MAKKSKSEAASESTPVDAPVAAAEASGAPKRKRGRPAGSKSAAKKPKAKGKRGRPKGSKNKKAAAAGMKRGPGRPKGSGNGKKESGNLRGMIVKIVREEVHAALLQAFKDM